MIELSNLKTARETLGFTQAGLAEAMGLSLRQYQEIEADPTKVRLIHINALQWVAFMQAGALQDPKLLPPVARPALKSLFEVMFGPTPS